MDTALAVESSTPARKPRTRQPAARPTARQVEKSIKTAVCLSADAMKRLAVFCAMEGRTQSSVIEELIGSSPQLRRYVVQVRDRAAGGNPDDRATQVASAA